MTGVAGGLMVAGALLAAIAGVGLLRFSDVFSRMHAATKPATLGLGLVVAGAMIAAGDPGARAKLAVVLVLQLVTAPVGAHLVGRAAFRSGTELPEDVPVTGPEQRETR